jgi:FSR family fosmidomycin resistance protein-like MFS transporter
MKRHYSRYIYLLSAGHLFTDLNQGALPAILPFFMAKYHFSYAAVASLVLAANLASTIVQPFFGQFADRASKPWIMSIGVLLAGGGLAATGFLSDYRALFTAVMISGIGTAAFHPEAAKMANVVSGKQKGGGFSIFSFGSNIGFALGPIITTAAILLWGIKGISLLILPAVIMAAVIASQTGALQKIDASEKTLETVPGNEVEKDRWIPFSLLSIVLFGRSVIFYGLNTFLSLYWINVLQQSKSAGSTALSILFICGAMGTLFGGRLADRFGFNKIIRGGFILLLPMLLVFTLTKNVTVATLLLLPISLALFVPYSPMVVLGQEYLPNRRGLASGVTLGLAVSVGGLAAPMLGHFADSYGLLSAMRLIAYVAIIPVAMTFTLPNLKRLQPQQEIATSKEG